MGVSPSTFRATFKAFDNEERFPKSLIRFYLELAALMLPQARWGQLYDYGSQLFAAHHLALEDKANRDAQLGLTPGVSFGVVSSKSAGPVSLSLDVTTGAEQGAGFWNLTSYGLRFYRLVRMVGMGGIQLGVPGQANGRLCVPSRAVIDQLVGFCGVPVFGEGTSVSVPAAPDDDQAFTVSPIFAGG